MTMYMNKLAILGASLLVLGACSTQIPDSGAGVGLNSTAQNAQRDAALRGTQQAATAPATARAATVAAQRPATATPQANTPQAGVSSADLAAAGIAPAAPASAPSATLAPAPVAAAPLPTPQAIPQTPPPATSEAMLAANPEISDEQNFQAVAGRETIESDAERRERQAAAYLLIETTALPNRPGDTGPNIVAYALQAPNNRGESVFERSSLSSERRFIRNCSRYRTPDEAQRDFISKGGPQRDRMGIDPDGDGFACGWDPQVFRSVATGN